ncbi:hypothetical protein ACSBR2_018432 [Camellia fascicularis]
MEEVIKFFETQHKGFYRNHMDEVIKFCEAQHKYMFKFFLASYQTEISDSRAGTELILTKVTDPY